MKIAKRASRIALAFLLALCIFLAAMVCFMLIADAIVDTAVRWIPSYARADLTGILAKESWSEQDYETLYAQTGLSRTALDEMKDKPDRILEFQDAFFYDGACIPAKLRMGISPEGIPHIFDRFYQINNSITHSQGGTGVGLHLTHSLVEMHHGTITAENNQNGCGSTFTIRIPLGCDHLSMEEIDSTHETGKKILPATPIIKETELTATEEKRRKKAKTNLTILVVDDEKEIQEYLKQELSDEYKVVTCNDGKEAYDYLFNHEVNMVVSDIMMKGMDGITLCKKIKQSTNFNHIPVILLTARNKVEEQVEGLEIEADAYIVKPFNTTVLRSHIASLLANRRILKNKFSGAQQQTDKIQKINLKSADEALIAKIMKIINENLADPNLNVETLASEVGLSRVHLHRKLKELTNLSTRDFIKNIRMQQAAELLKEKKLTISEVAYATGYSNLSHFSSTFKDTYGVTPKEYMQSNLTKENAQDEAAE